MARSLHGIADIAYGGAPPGAPPLQASDKPNQQSAAKRRFQALNRHGGGILRGGDGHPIDRIGRSLPRRLPWGLP